MAVWLALSLVLTGCRPAPTPPDMPRSPAGLKERFYAPRGWTWSALHVGTLKPIRYGVAGPPSAPKGSVLILTARDEPGEVWFETGSALVGQGYAVWLLEAAGSPEGRTLDPDAGVLQAMVSQIIRPRGGQPLVLVADGLGATLALRALSDGRLTGVQAVLLQSPVLDIAAIDAPITADQAETVAEWADRLRLGWLPLPGHGLTPDGIGQGLDPQRSRLAETWRRSDPTLSPQARSWGWLWAYDQAVRKARAPALIARITTPMILAASGSDERMTRLCAAVSTCTLRTDLGPAPHLAKDPTRATWINTLSALIERKRPARF